MSSSMAKAFVGVVVAFVGALITALGPGNESLGDLSTQTWLVVVGTTLGSGALVFIVDNIPGVMGSVAKAVYSALSAGVPALVAAFDDGVITQGEWLTAFSVAVAATGLVYQTSVNARGNLTLR